MLDAKVEYQMALNYQAEMRQARQKDSLAGRNALGNTAKSLLGSKAQLAIQTIITTLITVLSNRSD